MTDMMHRQNEYPDISLAPILVLAGSIPIKCKNETQLEGEEAQKMTQVRPFKREHVEQFS